MKVLIYIKEINPEPWTVPTVGIGRKNGKAYPTFSKKPLLRGYQEQLKENISAAYPDLEMFKEKMPLSLRIIVWRNLDTYATVAGTRTSQRADATNIQKATEDTLQGILYKNDSQVTKASCEVYRQERGLASAAIILCEPYVSTVDWDIVRDQLDAQVMPFPPGNVYVQRS